MTIEVKDNVIITEWWTSKEEEDGKKQITEETVDGKNKGRSNETTDNEQAILEYERKITVSYTHLTLPTTPYV